MHHWCVRDAIKNENKISAIDFSRDCKKLPSLPLNPSSKPIRTPPLPQGLPGRAAHSGRTTQACAGGRAQLLAAAERKLLDYPKKVQALLKVSLSWWLGPVSALPW